MRRRAEGSARLAAAALAWAIGACGPSDGVLVAREDHYRVTLVIEAPPARGDAGRLRLRVSPRGGWKVAPEAPVRLDLEAPGSLAFEPASIHLPEGAASEDGFELVTALHAYQSGRALAHGRLRFGICEGPQAQCVVVERELALPIEVASGG